MALHVCSYMVDKLISMLALKVSSNIHVYYIGEIVCLCFRFRFSNLTVRIHQDAQDQKSPKHESEKAAATVMNLHLKMKFTEQDHTDKECKINACITDYYKYTMSCLQSVWFTIVIIQHMIVLFMFEVRGSIILL